MKKQILALSLAASMALSMAPAAMASEQSDYVGEGGTYTMYMRSTFIDWLNDLEWYKEAEKRTGVTVEYVRVQTRRMVFILKLTR